MYTVVGIEKGKKYHFQDGNSCTGNVYYCTFERDNVVGVAVDRFFVSDKKLASCCPNGEPVLGSQINVYYNKFGKVEVIDVN